MEYKPLIDTSKEKYRRYVKQRRSVGCRPIDYFKWVEWQHIN